MFNRKEVNLLHDPYFRIIREEEQFVEIQSLNTGHCWNVFKNQFEKIHKIKLYHKHKQSDAYYHEHRICRNVVEAIEQIKGHDEYVLALAEKKKSDTEKTKKLTRQLKVYETRGYKYKPTPTIMLKGQWLEDLGFEINKSVMVKCEGGRLVVTLKDDVLDDIKMD